MTNGATCTLVIPCFNEAERLRADVFRDFLTSHPLVRMHFVDDGSTDETGELLAALQRDAPGRADVLTLAENRGKAEAVRRGLLAALALEPDVVGYLDADLATPLSAVPQLIAWLVAHPDLEMVLGSRVLLLGRRIERHALRHYLGRCFATCASLTLDLPVYDTQCGAKLFRATPLLRKILEGEFCSRWIFDVEILARWLAARGGADDTDIGRRIHEIPLDEWHDVGQSRLRAWDFLKAPLELWRIRRRYHPERRGRTATATKR